MKWMIIAALLLSACSEATEPTTSGADPKNECVFCADNGRADAYGIERESYLAYGIVELANTATFDELDVDVDLDIRAARGIVAARPFEFIEQIDTVPYVGQSAFAALATYAEANGYVPACGDGVVQPLLEACDDGNLATGDGCDASCSVESASPTRRHEDIPELIRGSDIDVPLVDPNAWYMRERVWKDRGYPAEVVALMERADGIIANQYANDRVGFDELAILSTTPFYESLLPDERAALASIWDMFEVSSDPIAVIDGNLELNLFPTTTVTRVGPIVMRPQPIANVGSTDDERLLQRLQQLPRLNLDGDPTTYELTDIERALADYQQVLTRAEVERLENLIDPLFEASDELASDGSYIAVFDEIPHDLSGAGSFATFGDYELVWERWKNMRFLADDADGNATTQAEVSFTMWLEHNGVRADCWTFQCQYDIDHDGVRYLTLGDEEASPNGYRIIEHWEDGQRLFNQIVYFAASIWQRGTRTDDRPSRFTAQYQLQDGTWLRLEPVGADDGWTSYELAPTTRRPNNLQTAMPTAYDALQRLLPGRYEPFHGYTLEVHASRTAVIYRQGSTQAAVMKLEDGVYTTWSGSHRLNLVFDDPDGARLEVRYNGLNDEIVLGSEDGQLRRDRTFIDERH